MGKILEVDSVSKSFTGHKALTDVSLYVEEGEVYGLLGPNGAGKTTLLRILNHITAPDKGTVRFEGRPLTAADVTNIGYLPEERGLYKKMKVGEQALFFARLKGLNSAEADKAVKEWFERLEIMPWWNRKVEELSKGMAQKVQFVITVLHKPRLLIFDEPFSGFDPVNAAMLKREILELRKQGATIIFSTHNMGSVEQLCDRITLINKSRNILTGSVCEIRREYSDNTFRMTFEENQSTLHGALEHLVHDFSVGAETDENGHWVYTFKLNSPELRSSVLTEANKIGDGPVSFNPVLPDMDTIFIKAVQQQTDINS